MQEYVMDQLLPVTQVSFFEPAREWHKPKRMGRSNLSMDMLDRQTDSMDLEKASTSLPGLTKSFGYSWRELGISERTGRPLDQLTQRQAIREVLLDANTLGLEGENTQGIKGLLNEVDAAAIVSATAVWSDFANAKPFEDIVKAIQKVREQEIMPPLFKVAMHPTNYGEAWRVRSSSNVIDMELIDSKLRGTVQIIQTTAIPEGTVLGIAFSPVYADLLTTGLPVVVPVEANALGVEFQIRMIAVPRVIHGKALFKITGV